MLIFIYLMAIVAEAMSGALSAGRRNMDIFGVAVIALSRRWVAAPCATSFWAVTRLAGRSTLTTWAW